MKNFVSYFKSNKKAQKYSILVFFLFISVFLYNISSGNNRYKFVKSNDLNLRELIDKRETDEQVINDLNQKENYVKKGDIYTYNDHSIFISKIDKITIYEISTNKVVKVLHYEDFNIHELYVYDNNLIILGNQREIKTIENKQVETFHFLVKVVDINSYIEVRNIKFIDCYFRYSKEIDSTLTLVLNNSTMYDNKKDEIILPKYLDSVNNKYDFLKSDIYITTYNETVHYYTIVVNINLNNILEKIHSRIVLGTEGITEITNDFLIFCSPIYEKEKTVIHILDKNTFKYVAQTEVDGYVYLNQNIYFNEATNIVSILTNYLNESTQLYNFNVKTKKLNTLNLSNDFNNVVDFYQSTLYIYNQTNQMLNIIYLSDEPKIHKTQKMNNKIEYLRFYENTILTVGRSTTDQNLLMVEKLDSNLLVLDSYKEKIKDFYLEVYSYTNLVYLEEAILNFPLSKNQGRYFYSFKIDDKIKKIEFAVKNSKEEYLTRFFKVNQNYFIFSNEYLYKYDENYKLLTTTTL